jgi:hypothetical protein
MQYFRGGVSQERKIGQMKNTTRQQASLNNERMPTAHQFFIFLFQPSAPIEMNKWTTTSKRLVVGILIIIIIIIIIMKLYKIILRQR